MKRKKIENILTSEDFMRLTIFGKDLKEGYFKDQILSFMREEMQHSQDTILIHAVKDKKTNEKEIQEWMTKYEVGRDDIAEVFKILYDTGLKIPTDSKEDEEKVVMITVKGSGIWKMRKMLTKRFNVEILGGEEGMKKMMELMEKEDAKNYDPKDHNYIG